MLSGSSAHWLSADPMRIAELLPQRLSVRILIASIAMGFALIPMHSNAATNNVTLRLRPHCEAVNQQECPSYAVKDPLTIQTPEIVKGSLIDMDLVIDNPTGQPITRVRGWMSYDSILLEGKKIEPSAAFPVVTPGEADFAALQGFLKLGLQTEAGKTVSDLVIPVARIQMLAAEVPQGGKTVIAFYDVQTSTDGHTAVIVDEDGQEKNVLVEVPGSLLVQLKQDQAAPIASAASSAPASAAAITSSSVTSIEASASSVASSIDGAASSISSVAAVPQEKTSFTLLQVQNLRLTTEGSTVYVAWDALTSSELQGYNVYYGAEMGRYLQRRTLPMEATTLTVRALPQDTTYYFAVRAINMNQEESAFSKEVAVKVGDPRTATAPLVLGQDTGPRGQNPLTASTTQSYGVPCKTGVSSILLLLFIASAVIGTLLAFRRQWTAHAHPL